MSDTILLNNLKIFYFLNIHFTIVSWNLSKLLSNNNYPLALKNIITIENVILWRKEHRHKFILSPALVQQHKKRFMIYNVSLDSHIISFWKNKLEMFENHSIGVQHGIPIILQNVFSSQERSYRRKNWKVVLYIESATDSDFR